MIADLPDLPSRKRGREQPLLGIGRRARVAFPAPSFAPAVAVADVATGLIKHEIRDAVKSLAFTALEKTVQEEKQQELRKELNESQALGVLATRYAGVIDGVPGPLALLLLIGQKYAKVMIS